MTLSLIEQLAQTIEDWNDGWRFNWNPDNHGRRARISRKLDDPDIVVEIEIHEELGLSYVFAGSRVRGSDGHWQAVSISVRNPVNRKALDFLNARLDELALLPENEG